MEYKLNKKYHARVTDQELLDDLAKNARKIRSRSITYTEYERLGKYSSYTVLSHFGLWNIALQKAGLSIKKLTNISQTELFDNMASVWNKLGRQPFRDDMRPPVSAFSSSPYRRIFGTWREALEKFVIYANNNLTAGVDDTLSREEFFHHKTKREPSWKLRYQVMTRDNYRCKACGATPLLDPTVRLHVDHITAWEKGGETELKNLQVLCEVCNIGKSNS